MSSDVKDEVCTTTMAAGDNPHLGVNKTDLRIDVIASPGGPDGVTYRLEYRGQNGDRIDLPRDSGPYKIHFDLDIEGGVDVRFDAAAPFFCGVDGGNCPAGLATGQIMVDSCDKNDLVIVDWNYGSEQQLRYQLNFVNRGGGRMPCYDPIIVNGGGTKLL